jgi:hypothetical protein
MKTVLAPPLRPGHRRRARLSLVCAILAGSLLVVASAGSQRHRPKTPILLFTDEEAAQLRLTAGDRFPDIERGVSEGPRIVIRKPHVLADKGHRTIETASPTDLTVQFEENGAPVDMQTLEVTARKGFFSKSLTPVLKPFLRGTTLDASQLAVPSGSFMVEIAISDSLGHKTQDVYDLRVD